MSPWFTVAATCIHSFRLQKFSAMARRSVVPRRMLKTPRGVVPSFASNTLLLFVPVPKSNMRLQFGRLGRLAQTEKDVGPPKSKSWASIHALPLPSKETALPWAAVGPSSQVTPDCRVASGLNPVASAALVPVPSLNFQYASKPSFTCGKSRVTVLTDPPIPVTLPFNVAVVPVRSVAARERRVGGPTVTKEPAVSDQSVWPLVVALTRKKTCWPAASPPMRYELSPAPKVPRSASLAQSPAFSTRSMGPQ